MKISDLIKALTLAQEEYGDIQVDIMDGDVGPTPWGSIDIRKSRKRVDGKRVTVCTVELAGKDLV